MAKIYKVKFKPKNLIILNSTSYFADEEYEIQLTDKEVVAYKPYMVIISHSLIGEKPEETETTNKRGRPPKKES